MHTFSNKEKWLEAARTIFQKFGLNPVVADATGCTVTPRDGDWCNDLCRAIRGNDSGRSAVCAGAREHCARLLRETGKPVIEECDAGMMQVVVPVMVGNVFQGCFGGCGKVFEGGEVDEFMIRKSTGLTDEDIGKRATTVAAITWSEADEIVEFLEEQVRDLVGA